MSIVTTSSSTNSSAGSSTQAFFIVTCFNAYLLLCILVLALVYLTKRCSKWRISGGREQISQDVEYHRALNHSTNQSSINAMTMELQSLREMQSEMRSQVLCLRSIVAKVKERKE
jgi:hypothetical protein